MARVRRTPYPVVFEQGAVGWDNPGGRIFYVAASGWTSAGGGASPSDSNSGLSPSSPFATIQKGLDSCTAGRGDQVAILPGSFTVTAAITMTKADVMLKSAVYVGPHEYSPVIITAAATFDDNLIQVDADNVTISGLGFECGFTTVTANQEVIQVNSTNTTTDIYGCIIENCYFDHLRAAGAATTTDTDLDTIKIGLDANDRAFNSIVRGCTIVECDQDAIVVNVGSLGAKILNNRIYDGTALTRIGVSLLGVGAEVTGNYIMCGTTSDTAGPVSVGVAAALARVHNNYLIARGADTVGITVINTATVFSSGNWINAVAAGNIVDFKTAATSPSSSADIANVYAADPALAALTAATVAGT